MPVYFLTFHAESGEPHTTHVLTADHMSAIWGYLFRLHAQCKTMHGTFCCSDEFNFQLINLITLALKRCSLSAYSYVSLSNPDHCPCNQTEHIKYYNFDQKITQ